MRDYAMPFTPFHWGPSSWIGLIFFRTFDLATLLISSVIIDVEPFCSIFLKAPWPVHGFLHTFSGGSIVAIITAVMCYILKGPIRKAMNSFKLSQDSSFMKIIWTSFFGVYSHILLDAFLYMEMNPFYPHQGNPFFGLFSLTQIYIFCGISFVVGIGLYLFRIK
jgi:membrane-bound metal-dependent hydrolase YbcI (DUF457 family)